MVFFDPNDLDELAFNFHYHGERTIGLEDLEKRGLATIEHLVAFREQISNYIAMWRDTYRDMGELLIEMRRKEMSE